MFIAFIFALTACLPETDNVSDLLSIELRVNEALVQNNTASAFRGQELTFVPTLIGASETITEPTFTWSFQSQNSIRDPLRNEQETLGGSTVNNGVVTVKENESMTMPIRLNVSTVVDGKRVVNHVDIDVTIDHVATTLAATFECENLAQNVALTLGVGIYDEITTADLARITSLTTRGQSISSLNGIEYLLSLTTLNLDNSQISDISALSSLTNLVGLWLNNNQISDLRPLENLNLFMLFANNQVLNLDPTTVGESVPFNLYLPNTPLPLAIDPEVGSFVSGQLTWLEKGEHTATWNAFNSGQFSGTIHQTVTQVATDPEEPTEHDTLANIFECEQLARAVSRQIPFGINDEIDLAILKNITTLHDSGGGIYSLSGIEFLPNLNSVRNPK